jgi:FdhD protein
VIYVSHSMDEVARLAQHMVLLGAGKVLAQGSVTELLSSLDLPLAHGDVASSVVHATVHDHDAADHLSTLIFDGGRLQLVMARPREPGSTYRCACRRDVSLSLLRPEGSSILNILPVQVLGLREDGPGQVMVSLQAGDTRLLASHPALGQGLAAAGRHAGVCTDQGNGTAGLSAAHPPLAGKDAPADYHQPMTESSCPIPAQPIAPLHTHAVSFFNAGQQELQERVLAAEVPIALVFNGISHAVMMGSPTDVEDFALGFALTEGIIDSAADCYGIEARPCLPPRPACPEVQLDIASRCFARLKDKRRSMTGRTGAASAESRALRRWICRLRPCRPRTGWVDAATVLKAIGALAATQILNAEAGAIHAAGWATLARHHGCAEDVGRHNALDKLVGRLARTGRLGSPAW